MIRKKLTVVQSSSKYHLLLLRSVLVSPEKALKLVAYVKNKWDELCNDCLLLVGSAKSLGCTVLIVPSNSATEHHILFSHTRIPSLALSPRYFNNTHMICSMLTPNTVTVIFYQP